VEPGVSDLDSLQSLELPQVLEGLLGRPFQNLVESYPSYVNRVFGLRTDEGENLIIKIYRPGRWSQAALVQEHLLVRELAEAGLPVVAPQELPGGGTLGTLEQNHQTFRFALYPKKSGRLFDAQGPQDWQRIGALAGRMHLSAREVPADQRLEWSPAVMGDFLQELMEEEDLIPDHLADPLHDLGNRIPPGVQSLRAQVKTAPQSCRIREHGTPLSGLRGSTGAPREFREMRRRATTRTTDAFWLRLCLLRRHRPHEACHRRGYESPDCRLSPFCRRARRHSSSGYP